MRPYQICSNCVMDTTDSKIEFDESGVCDHWRGLFKQDVLPNWYPNDEGKARFPVMVDKIKEAGRDHPFDCILGMSGGLDSSYLLPLAVSGLGLRPLVFHVDGGRNTDLAVNNMQVLVDGMRLDLYTEVINWDEMRDLKPAFFKSGGPHLDILQDHASIPKLYQFATHNIKFVLNGGNFATECVRNPMEWLYHGTDMAQLRDIHRRFGTRSLILTGQMTREEALEKPSHPAYDPTAIDEEFEYIATKLGITVDELRQYHHMPLKIYKDYANQQWMFDLGARVLKSIGVERSVKR